MSPVLADSGVPFSPALLFLLCRARSGQGGVPGVQKNERIVQSPDNYREYFKENQ